MAQLTKHKHFQQSFELSEGDVRLPKLFRQTVPQCWPGGGKTVVTDMVHVCDIFSIKKLANSNLMQAYIMNP